MRHRNDDEWVGRWFVRRYREIARAKGREHAAGRLRKQGVPPVVVDLILPKQWPWPDVARVVENTRTR